MNRLLLGLALLCTSTVAFAEWNAASDERRRQQTINDMNRNAAQASSRASQYSNNRYTPSGSSSSSSGSSSRSSGGGGGSYNTLDAIQDSLDAYQKQQPTQTVTYTITRKESPQALAARIRAGAERGDPFMQWTLGRMYNSGVGVPSNGAEAVRWFRAAAERGSADGQASLGDMYYAGTGVAKDMSTAVSWWTKAAAQGHGVAAKNAAASYQNAWGVPKDLGKARDLYKIAAATRDPQAALWLGELYRDGAFGGVDMKSACPLFKIAADQGLLHGMDNYSTCVPENEILGWVRKAADGGLPRARFKLGMAILNGIAGLQKDPVAGAKLIIESAPGVTEDTKPLMISGTLYLNGVGVKKNVVEAARYYHLAAERGDPKGNQALGEVTQKCSAGRWGQALAIEGFDLLTGKNGVTKDEAKAFAKIKEAAEAGSLSSIGAVASLLHDGVGTKADHAQAAFYWHTAALLGVPPAKRDWGVIQCVADGVEKNEASCWKWLKEAAADGDAEASYRVGKVYEEADIGQAKDLVKARAAYKAAADAGFDDAKKALEGLSK